MSAIFPLADAAARPAGPPVLRAIGNKLISVAFFATMAALIKSVGETYPTGEIVFFRSFFALVPTAVMVARAGGMAALRTDRPFAHIKRSAAGLAAMTLSFAGLALLPLATATAIGFAAPIFITLFAMPMLAERVGLDRWVAVLAGFAGVALVLDPTGHGVGAGGLLPLGGAFFTALAMIYIRRMGDREPSVCIVFYFTLCCTVGGLLSLPFGWVMPDPIDFARLVAIGCLGGVAQFFMTRAFQYAPASAVAPFEYASLLFAIGFGWLFWADLPGPTQFAGSALIVAAGLVIALRERRSAGAER
jgi:drug/metabolite transporter (DMT)-like permease